MNVEELKKERPDLVELFESMSRKLLLEQCYKECIDAIEMEKRVAIFMEECTIGMSKTNYTEASLRSMITDKHENDIQQFCYYEICDEETDEEIVKSIREKARGYEHLVLDLP